MDDEDDGGVQPQMEVLDTPIPCEPMLVIHDVPDHRIDGLRL